MNSSAEYLSGDGNAVWIYDRSPTSIPGCSAGMLYKYIDGGLQSTMSMAPLCPETGYPSFFLPGGKFHWMGTPEELVKISGQKFTRFPLNTDPLSGPFLITAAIAKDRLLAAVRNNASGSDIFIYDPQHDSGQPLQAADFTFPGISIQTACADYLGNFWLSASDGSIIRITRAGTSSVFYKPGHAVLPNNSVTSLLMDSQDHVWAGTKGGMARFDGQNWTIYPNEKNTFFGNNVSALTMDSEGTLWAGFQQPPIMSSTQCGIAVFDGKSWHKLFQDHRSIKALAFDAAGALWSLTIFDIARYSNITGKQPSEMNIFHLRDLTLNKPGNAIAFGTDNTPYIGTDRGIKKIVNSQLVDAPDINPGNPVSKVTALHFSPNGTAWIGTEKGLLKCEGGKCSLFDTSGHVLPSLTVRCIAPSAPDKAWIGTNRGLVHLTDKGHVTYDNSNSPLLDNDITAITMAKNGDLWAGTALGGLTVLYKSSMDTISLSARKSHPSRPFQILVYKHPHGNGYRLMTPVKLPSASKLILLSTDGRIVNRLPPVSSTTGTVFEWEGSRLINRGMVLAAIICRGATLGLIKLPLL
jgi:ligand-binding sensor domain-containing protein